MITYEVSFANDHEFTSTLDKVLGLANKNQDSVEFKWNGTKVIVPPGAQKSIVYREFMLTAFKYPQPKTVGPDYPYGPLSDEFKKEFEEKLRSHPYANKHGWVERWLEIANMS